MTDHTTALVILRDASGGYYAIPFAALASFRVPEQGCPALQEFLSGEATPAPWSFRTTCRSDELWLISR